MARKASKEKITNTKTENTSTYWQKLEGEVQNNQSKLSMILGGLIILVIGILVFNFFNKNKGDINGSAQNTEQETQEQQTDVSPENLPGKYTIKEGDTLFLVAEKYYKDGYKFSEIAKANNLSNPDVVEKGLVLEIPKLDLEVSTASAEIAQTPEPSITPTPSPTATATPTVTPAPTTPETVTPLTTDWGPKIAGTTYTVVEDDWLSTIAARAYGDIFSYDKIAKANNIANPDYIQAGTVLVIPR